MNIENLNFKSGIFTKELGYIDEKNNKGFEISLIREKENKNTIKITLSVKNNSDSNIHLNSFLIAEFVLKNVEIKQILRNSWTQSGNSKFTNKFFPTKKPMFFLKRDFNPLSFKKSFGYVKKSVISEWYTLVTHKSGHLFVGAITTNRFYSQIFMKKSKNNLSLRITSQADQIELNSKEELKSETILVTLENKNKALTTFADGLWNRSINTNKKLKGLCCAYYFQGNKVDEKYVIEQLEVIEKNKLKFDVLQIDAGYCVWGDWKETKKAFPNGLSFISKEINKRGITAGIWIAPFVASPESNLFKNHKEWFVKNEKGNYLEVRYTTPIDFLPILSLRLLDITNIEVQEFIKKTIRDLVDMGFRYIKTDFTYPYGFSTNYSKKITRVEALRKGFELINEVSGDSLIQTSITQLSLLVGLIDYARTSIDTINPFVCNIPIFNSLVNNKMLKDNIESNTTRGFLNGKVWINDYDCVVLRKKTGLKKSIQSKHIELVKNSNVPIWVGDNIMKLDEKTIKNILIPILEAKEI